MWALLLRAGSVLASGFELVAGASVGEYAAGIAARIFGPNIVASMPSFIQKGAEYLKMLSGSKKIIERFESVAKNMRFDLSSESSITKNSITAKIQAYIANRVSEIRSANPSANIKTIVNSGSQGGYAPGNQSGKGFVDFADALDVISGNIDTIVNIEGSASAETMRRKLQTYPPEIYDSLYKRTFQLQHGWEVAFVSFDAGSAFAGDVMNAPSMQSTSISFKNSTPYATWVQRRATQTRVHRGRWNTVEDVAEAEEPVLEQRVAQALSHLLEE